MIKVSTKTYRKNGECLEISVLLEDDLGKWLLTQPESVIHDFVLFEYKNNGTNRAQYRRVQSLDASVDNGYDFEDEDSDVIALLMKETENNILHRAISQLTPKQQWIIEQIYYLDRKQVEIAKEMNIVPSSLNEQLQRIYAHLKKYLKNF